MALAVALLLALALGGTSWRIALHRLDARLDQSLILARRAVETEIERVRPLPAVVAEDSRVRAAAARPDDAGLAREASRHLQVVARLAGSSLLYLLDEEGTAIAASNWDAPGSLVGESYAFRPYFRDAMRQGPGRFYGIGVTTGEPGYFLAVRMTVEGRNAVVVAKVDLRPLEATWSAAAVAVAIADEDGVVFLSGVDEWRYRPLRPLPPEVLVRAAERRTWTGIDLAGRPPLLASAAPDDPPRPLLAGEEFRARTAVLPADGWTLISAEPTGAARRAGAVAALVAALGGLALAALLSAAAQRRRAIQMRLRQGEILEARVVERTAALTQEAETRRRAEADLRVAQDGLIHAEKMAALGRMSAAIVHEISQPLAAMEATLMAATLGSEPLPEPASRRIATARSHVQRLLRTVRHLKSFSRREPSRREPVALRAAVEAAAELVAPRLRGSGACLVLPDAPVGPTVLAGQARLEQVILNLLLNALDAVQGRPKARIEVSWTMEKGEVRLTVADTGAGMSPEALERAGEPFFTSKPSGEGLGLGLAISRAILEEFGGRLVLESVEGEGTCVIVGLPTAGAGTGSVRGDKAGERFGTAA